MPKNFPQCSYHEDQGWNRCQSLNVDERNGLRQMALSGAHEEQPGGGKDGAVQRAECGAGHEEGHREREDTEHLVTESHSHRLRAQDFLAAQHNEVGDVRDHVDDGHQRHRDADRPRKVPEKF